MKDNLPPLPPYAPEFKPRWDTDPGGYNEDQMKAYARAAIERQSVPAEPTTRPANSQEWAGMDASTAFLLINRHADGWPDIDLMMNEWRIANPAPQPQPAQPLFAEMIAKHPGLREELAAAPQPQPVQPEGPMAETVEQAARDVAKCLNERDGQGLDLRHVAMLVHYAQQPVQEPVAEIKISGDDFDLGLTDAFAFGRLRLPDGNYQLYTSPQAQPLSDEQINRIHASIPWDVNGLAFGVALARAVEAAHGINKPTA